MVILVGAVWATAALAGVRVSVTPGTGARTAKFVIGFRAPNATGVSSGSTSRYVVSATATAGHGCTSGVSAGVPPTQRGQYVRVTLKPGAGRRWCAERFHGRITEIVSLNCHPLTTACPDFEAAPLTVATFTFRVRP